MREVLKDTKFQKLKNELNSTKNTSYATNEIYNSTFPQQKSIKGHLRFEQSVCS